LGRQWRRVFQCASGSRGEEEKVEEYLILLALYVLRNHVRDSHASMNSFVDGWEDRTFENGIDDAVGSHQLLTMNDGLRIA
jgi:hypothetical protein